MKVKIDKMDFIKSKIFALSNTVKRIKRQAKDWRKYLQNTHISAKVHVSKDSHTKIFESTIRKQKTY